MRRSGRVTVAAGLALVLAATTGRAAEVRLGAQGGLSRATLSVANLDTGLETDWRNGYDAGLRLEIGLGRTLTVVLAPSLVERGGSVHEAAQDERIRLETRYFEAPVLLKLSAGRSVRPYVLAGASFAWRNDARLSLELQGEEIASEDPSSYTRGNDVLLQAGGGVELATGGRVSVFAEGLYSWGLRGLDNGSEDAPDFVDARNRGFTVRAGFAVRLGR